VRDNRTLAFLGAVVVVLLLAGLLVVFGDPLFQELGLFNNAPPPPTFDKAWESYKRTGYADRTASTAVDTEQPKLNPPAAHKTTDPAGSVPAETTNQATGPALTTDEIQRLTEERSRAVGMLAAFENMLNTPSFAARAEIYCRFTMERMLPLAAPGVEPPSWRHLEDRYQELLRSEPTTLEGERQRQRQLSALRYFAIDPYRKNLSACQNMVTNGLQGMPSGEELRGKAAQAQRQIREIDQEIASGRALAPAPARR
jgi:hypothetical protein